MSGNRSTRTWITKIMNFLGSYTNSNSPRYYCKWCIWGWLCSIKTEYTILLKGKPYQHRIYCTNNGYAAPRRGMLYQKVCDFLMCHYSKLNQKGKKGRKTMYLIFTKNKPPHILPQFAQKTKVNLINKETINNVCNLGYLESYES